MFSLVFYLLISLASVKCSFLKFQWRYLSSPSAKNFISEKYYVSISCKAIERHRFFHYQIADEKATSRIVSPSRLVIPFDGWDQDLMRAWIVKFALVICQEAFDDSSEKTSRLSVLDLETMQWKLQDFVVKMPQSVLGLNLLDYKTLNSLIVGAELVIFGKPYNVSLRLIKKPKECYWKHARGKKEPRHPRLSLRANQIALKNFDHQMYLETARVALLKDTKKISVKWADVKSESSIDSLGDLTKVVPSLEHVYGLSSTAAFTSIRMSQNEHDSAKPAWSFEPFLTLNHAKYNLVYNLWTASSCRIPNSAVILVHLGTSVIAAYMEHNHVDAIYEVDIVKIKIEMIISQPADSLGDLQVNHNGLVGKDCLVGIYNVKREWLYLHPNGHCFRGVEKWWIVGENRVLLTFTRKSQAEIYEIYGYCEPEMLYSFKKSLLHPNTVPFLDVYVLLQFGDSRFWSFSFIKKQRRISVLDLFAPDYSCSKESIATTGKFNGMPDVIQYHSPTDFWLMSTDRGKIVYVWHRGVVIRKILNPIPVYTLTVSFINHPQDPQRIIMACSTLHQQMFYHLTLPKTEFKTENVFNGPSVETEITESTNT